ncbi:MAG: site-specific integrase [Thermoanaerobacteraceae bacterium]|nr:site-specific integrase [Thermoanaerobacteraceae bacterium]
MAHISKRKDGRWQAVIELPPDPKTGKRRQKWLYADTRQEVKRLANELEAKIASGNYTEPTKLTVEGYLLQWLEVYCKKLSPTTVDGYRIYIEKHINPFLGKIKLQKLKPIDIQKFYNSEKEKGYSNTTILQEHRILHRAFKEAVRNSLIERNPCDMVDPPKLDDFQPKIYDQDKFNKLLNAIAGTEDEIPVLLAGLLGLRRGEVFGLRWSDINFQEKTLSVRQTLVYANGELKFKPPKTKKSVRTITIPDGLIPILKEHRKRQLKAQLESETYKEYGLVCCRKDGDKINPRSYSRHFKDLLKKHGLPHIRLHDLRHFNATMMLKYGIDVKIAAERLGHSTPSTTQKIYQHVLKDMDMEAAEKLNKILGK